MDSSPEAEIKQLINQWIITGWKKGNTDLLDQFHTEDFRDHDSAGRRENLEGFKDGIRKLYAAFPDFSAEVEDILVDKSLLKAAVRWTGKGTHKGEYMGFIPSGKLIFFKGIELLEIERGRIKGRWGEWDGLSLIEQMK